MAEEYEIKGSSIRSKLAFVRDRFGEDAERQLAADLAAAGVKQVLEGSWYPFALYDLVLRRIAERHYGGDLAGLQDVGEFSARHSLAGTYRVYSDVGGFERLLQRLPSLHQRFYSRGRSVVDVQEGRGRCILELRDAPAYPETDLQVAAGFYKGSGEAMGCRNVSVHFTPREGAVRFEIRWDP